MTSIRRVTTGTLLVLGIAGRVGLGARQQPPVATFRAETNLVEVDAVVTDGQGNVVRGLTKNDFTILEDGRPQVTSTFAFVDLPIDVITQVRPGGAETDVDVSTNARPFAGRVYMMVLDDLESDGDFWRDVIKAARLFIEQYFQDNDLMTIVYTSGRKDVGQDFTNNRRLLMATVDAFAGRREYLDVGSSASLSNSGNAPPTGGQVLQFERASFATKMLALVKGVADWSNTTMPGRRKTMLLFSQGVGGFSEHAFDDIFSSTPDVDSSPGGGLSLLRSVAEEARDTMAAASRANVSVTTIDARGLAALGGNVADTSREAISTDGHGILRAFAEETGGSAVLRTNNFPDAFERVVHDASSYYVMAYVAPPAGKPGQFHSITVKVDKPGVEVRARRGYATPGRQTVNTAPPIGDVRVAAVSPELNAAISSPLPSTGVALSVFAVPFKGKNKNASVLVGTELGNLTLGQLGPTGRFKDEIELSSVAVDARTVKDGRTDHVHLALTPETLRTTAGGVRVLHRLDLPPGKYQLRVAVRDNNSGRLGSVMRDLEVPDFGASKTTLDMSGLVLTSAHANASTTTGEVDPLTSLLESPPAALREFAPADELVVFAEIYDHGAPSHQDAVTTQILDETGHVALETVDTVSNDDLRGNGGAYQHHVRLRLDDLAPGRYVLKVEAESLANRDARASRMLTFTVAK